MENRTERLSLSKIVILVIIALITLASFVGIYLAQLFHTSGPKSVKLIGICEVVHYFLPDTEQILIANVTTTHDNTTSYYLTTYSTITATVETLGSSIYTTTTLTNSSTIYVITNTTNDNSYIPSAAWFVSKCTFVP